MSMFTKWYLGFLRLTFTGVFGTDYKLKVCSITKSVGSNDFPLQLKDRDARSIKCNSGRLLLRLEAKEDGG